MRGVTRRGRKLACVGRSAVDVDHLRDERGDHREHRFVVVVERHRQRAVDHEHADELAAHHRRDRDAALRVVQPGQRHVALGADVAHRVRTSGARSARTSASAAAGRRAPARSLSAAAPATPSPNATSEPTPSAGYPWLAMVNRRVALLVEEHHRRVAVARAARRDR